MFFTLVETVFKACIVIVPVLIFVAFLVYFERKIIGAIQLRAGPSIVGPFGLLQSFADAVKVMFKEVIIPTKANIWLFLLAPLLTFGLALSGWAIIPFTEKYIFANLNFGAMYVMAISGLGIYGIIIAGWASNSKYAFFGAIRSAAQMISYEISIGFCVMSVCAMVGSLNLIDIVNYQKNYWFCIVLFPLFIVFYISMLAETNRHPFDLPEAESELVSGYNVEYSSTAFTLFFLGERINLVFMCSFCTIMFFGGWLPPFNYPIFNIIPGFIWFLLKVCFLLYVSILLWASLPRYRFDQLMRLGWKFLLPISLFCFVVIAFYKII